MTGFQRLHPRVFKSLRGGKAVAGVPAEAGRDEVEHLLVDVMGAQGVLEQNPQTQCSRLRTTHTTRLVASEGILNRKKAETLNLHVSLFQEKN